MTRASHFVAFPSRECGLHVKMPTCVSDSHWTAAVPCTLYRALRSATHNHVHVESADMPLFCKYCGCLNMDVCAGS